MAVTEGAVVVAAGVEEDFSAAEKEATLARKAAVEEEVVAVPLEAKGARELPVAQYNSGRRCIRILIWTLQTTDDENQN
ncbi:hypothetical protein DPMN_156640 [Dreissena polymorpha]|uniref:Uncharacterized protein n=1 Tax=Dreissena polymorpha TaxID=45954 RepID=A0A9D4JCJ6_DREPO|nr:hypothetical protein DPMN_156640 [Dreissena polymorpha]